MVVGGSQQETLDLGFVLFDTRQKGVLVILRELMLPDGFDPVTQLQWSKSKLDYELSIVQFSQITEIMSPCEIDWLERKVM
ncbi:unnamed protein product [Schistosoma margrebowiei]|uniref:Uncharacterized protein n=1 Tax=Schistosoma margrebowiei TaxID=48269 RepID=A0A183N8Z3_9TREM|nr:unnamed protein product [Schistosoma margrebowiei]